MTNDAPGFGIDELQAALRQGECTARGGSQAILLKRITAIDANGPSLPR